MNRLAPWLAWVALGCTPLDDPSFHEVADGGLPAEGRPLPPLFFSDERSPPPISGGTLAISPDGRRAVVADPDRERVQIVDLERGRVRESVPVPGLEPGRVVAGDVRAWVALRRGGVVELDLGAERAVRHLDPCPGVRGLALHGDALFVACVGGDVLRLDAATGAIVETVATLPPDLRDIVRSGDAWWVSRFQSAEIYRLGDDGSLIVLQPPVDGFAPRVAWRLRALPDGGVALLHQRHRRAPLASGDAAYVADPVGCEEGPLHAALTLFAPDGTVAEEHPIAGLVLPVDFAITDGLVALAAPGQWRSSSLRVLDLQVAFNDGCVHPEPLDGGLQATAVALGDRVLWYQSREPARLVPLDLRGGDARAPIDLPGASAFDSGHDLFHVDAGGGIACAGCHPEGGSDGHTWTFEIGLRHTQPVWGPLAITLPLHWNGEFPDFAALVDDILVGRMGGTPPDPAIVARLADWLETVRPPIHGIPLAPARVARGAEVFATRCARCHQGAQRTDNLSHPTGGPAPLQTPPLRALWPRDRFFHEGCEGSLRAPDDFIDCAREAHGPAQHDLWDFARDTAARDALIEFLKSL
ncbi:MAG: c-type cytochrome [bacterium]